MNEKNIPLTSELLAALHVLNGKRHQGVEYMVFVKGQIMGGARDLLDGGYSEKIIVDGETNYRLTPKGIDYLSNIMDFANKKF